jgi:hypothetical protein
LGYIFLFPYQQKDISFLVVFVPAVALAHRNRIDRTYIDAVSAADALIAEGICGQSLNSEYSFLYMIAF